MEKEEVLKMKEDTSITQSKSQDDRIKANLRRLNEEAAEDLIKSMSPKEAINLYNENCYIKEALIKNPKTNYYLQLNFLKEELNGICKINLQIMSELLSGKKEKGKLKEILQTHVFKLKQIAETEKDEERKISYIRFIEKFNDLI